MRIAYFTESLPPQTDGVSHTLSKLAETLERTNIDFKFFSPFKPASHISWSQRVFKVWSVPFLLYPEYRLSLPMFDKLFHELDVFNPDIIHVASPTPLGVVGLDYARQNQIPSVASYHTHFVHYFRYYGFKPIENLGWGYLRWFHNRCQMTFAPSHSAVRELLERGVEMVELWQRGVDTQLFTPEKRDLSLRRSIAAEDKPVILFVGRLVKEKDLEDLVNAINILQNWNLNFQAVIVGDGPMRMELENQLPLAYFTGYLKGDLLARWYASSDIFAFPSTTETFGNVVQEAFASGLPAVGVNKGGVADLIQPTHTGFIAQANDPLDFARYLRILIENPNLRRNMSQYAREFAEKNSWETINLGLFDHYERVFLSYYSRN